MMRLIPDEFYPKTKVYCFISKTTVCRQINRVEHTAMLSNSVRTPHITAYNRIVRLREKEMLPTV